MATINVGVESIKIPVSNSTPIKATRNKELRVIQVNRSKMTQYSIHSWSFKRANGAHFLSNTITFSHSLVFILAEMYSFMISMVNLTHSCYHSLYDYLIIILFCYTVIHLLDLSCVLS